MTQENIPINLNPERVSLEYIASLNGQYNALSLTEKFTLLSGIQGLSPVTLEYISDNGVGDLASAEIDRVLKHNGLALAAFSGKVQPAYSYTNSPAQNPIASAFMLNQLARHGAGGVGSVTFLNCAPRKKEAGQAVNNGGESVYVGILPSGAVVAGVGPDSFAFFRDLVVSGELEIYKTNVQIDGTQFRSRDIFPYFAQLLAHNLGENQTDWKSGLSVAERKNLLEKLNFIDTKSVLGLDHIPDYSTSPVIAYVDVHGNAKLSVRKKDANPEWLTGEKVYVRINDQAFPTSFGNAMFNKAAGNVSLSTGSSGRGNPADFEDAFLEVAIIGDQFFSKLGLAPQDLKNGVAVEILTQEEHEYEQNRKASNDNVFNYCYKNIKRFISGPSV